MVRYPGSGGFLFPAERFYLCVDCTVISLLSVVPKQFVIRWQPNVSMNYLRYALVTPESRAMAYACSRNCVLRNVRTKNCIGKINSDEPRTKNLLVLFVCWFITSQIKVACVQIARLPRMKIVVEDLKSLSCFSTASCFFAPVLVYKKLRNVSSGFNGSCSRAFPDCRIL